MPAQTQIPVIQDPNASVVQLQQNTNKVLRNLQTQSTDFQMFLNENTIVGEIKIANLSQTQFQAVAGPDWLLTNGQSSVGTKYAALTGNNTVPTATFSGINGFIRVN